MAIKDLLRTKYSPRVFAKTDTFRNIVLEATARVDDADSLSVRKLVCYVAYCHLWDDGCFEEYMEDPVGYWGFCVEQMVATQIAASMDYQGFLRGFFLKQVEGKEETCTMGQSSFGKMCSTVFTKAVSAAVVARNLVYGACDKVVEGTADWVWYVAEMAFKSAMGRYYTVIEQTAGWVKNVWSSMKKWCADLLATQMQWMQSFEECIGYGIGVVGIAAVLSLLERFLMASGIISGPVGMASTFLLVFLGYLGFKEGGVLFSHTSEMLAKLVQACRGIVDSIAGLFGATGTNGAGGQDATSLLETFATSLGDFDLVKVGRSFNAVTQVANGVKTVWTCVQQVCGYLWNVLDRCFGIQSRALADLSVMLGHDLQGWLRRCDAACEYLTMHTSVPQDILRTFRVLRCNGQQIRNALVKREVRGSAVALVTVTKALDRLVLLLNSAILAGTGGPRREPFWVYVVGKAGVGKSTLVNKLTTQYLASKDLDALDIYPRNTSDAFWSNYRRQTVVTYDDLGALSSPTMSEEGELLKLVSRDAVALNMANLEEKGMYFDSSLIVTSSNFPSANPKGNMHDKCAYDRRRSIYVEVVQKPNTVMNVDDLLGHQRYIVRERMEPYNVISTYDDFTDFYAWFVDQLAAHERKEDAIMANLDIPEKTISTSLNLMALAFTGYVPISIDEIGKRRHPGCTFLACYENVLYFTNGQMELVQDSDLTGVDAEDLKRAEEDSLATAMKYSNMLKLMPSINPMAAHFLVELVSKDVYDAKLQVRKSVYVDVSLGEVAESLPNWQRILVRIMGGSMSAGGVGWFAHLYDDLVTNITKVHLPEIKDWPMIVKLGVGILAFLVFGKTIFWMITRLSNFGYGAAFSVAAVRTFCLGQSDDEVHRKTSEYRHRNTPIRTRHWSKGQNFGVGHEWLMKHCLAYIRCGHLEGQVVMLPGRRLIGVTHLLRKLPDGAMVEISMDEQTYHVGWHKKGFKELADSELSVYSHPTLREVVSTVGDRVMYGIEHLPDSFQATFCSCKRDELSGDYVPESASIMVKKKNTPLHVYAGAYQRMVPLAFEYEAPTVNKDCGSLIIANIGGVDKLVGVHVAGIGGRGHACFLPLELDIAIAQNFEADVDLFPFEEQVANGISVIGLLKKDKQFHMPHKTAYKETPEEWHLSTPCDKVPAVLAKRDERLRGTEHYDYDPYRSGMEKYAQEAGPFSEGLLKEVCDEIVETWFDASDSFDFSESTLEEAINGIDGVDYFDPLVMNTSEGYPHLLSRQGTKGKARFFQVGEDGRLEAGPELMGYISKLEDECAAGVPELVGVEHAKDEKLPVKKVFEKPKTRLFTVVPMEFNIVIRKKFLKFVRFIMRMRDVLPCQVGVNPYSREWNRIAISLLEKGNDVLCCDYSRFDGLISKQVMWHIGTMINSLCKGNERLCSQRMHLLLACCSRYGICTGKVWRVENGIPSGVALTVILNSLFNEVIVRYVYKKAFSDRIMRNSFSRYVRMVVYGDDNLISVSACISDQFNGPFVKEEASNLGIVITDGCDKSLPTLNFRRLEECDFLKRSFVRDGQGLWRAPMELTSLWSQLHWVKTTHLEMAEAYLVNLESVLRELWLHDSGMAGLYRRRALALRWVKPENVPTIAQLESFHDSQMNGSDYSGYAYDQLVTPELLGPITRQVEDDTPFSVGKLWAYVASKYKYAEGDFVVTLGRHANKFGDAGMVLAWEVGSGRGELPTAGWLHKCFLRKNGEIHKKLVLALQNNERIVFLSRSSLVYATVFLVLFGRSVDVIDVMNANLIVTKAISVVKSLGYLPEAFPELFFKQDVRKFESVFTRCKFLHCFAKRAVLEDLRIALSGVALKHTGDPPPCVLAGDKEALEARADLCRRVAISGCFITYFVGERCYNSDDIDLAAGEWELRCVLSVFEDTEMRNFESSVKLVMCSPGKLVLYGLINGVCYNSLTPKDKEVVHPLYQACRLFLQATNVGNL